MDKKICTKCGEEKGLDLFPIHRKAPDGRMAECKECHNKRNRLYYYSDIEKSKARSRRNAAKYNSKPESKKKKSEYSKKRREEHRDELIAKDRIYKATHKIEMALYRKEYYSRPDVKERTNRRRREKYATKDRERINKRNRDWYKKLPKEKKSEYCRHITEARRTDPQKKLAHVFRCRMNNILSGKSSGGRLKEYIGCDMPFFIRYMEGLFTGEMSWDNYGHGKDKWVVDHILPVKAFDLSDPFQQRACFNWRNLQPMWYLENASKRDKHDLVDLKLYLSRFADELEKAS